MHALVKQFGESVRRHRQRRGWSQEQLAEAAELDRTYVSGIERGTRNPTLSTMGRIADALEVEVVALLCDTPEQSGELMR
jgi:transcriptional regulator with XRE-family HTH domain